MVVVILGVCRKHQQADCLGQWHFWHLGFVGHHQVGCQCDCQGDSEDVQRDDKFVLVSLAPVVLLVVLEFPELGQRAHH